MKNSTVILTLVSALLGLTLNAQQFNYANGYSPDVLAERLIAFYDLDNTGALNELELSTAIDYLTDNNADIVYSNPEIQEESEQILSPKVAVTLRRNFDQNRDNELCEDELAIAIVGLDTIES